MSRPDGLVLVAGTGTEVGKTWWTAAVARALRSADIAVAARKPVQSFEPGDDATDADVLAEATGVPPDEVCPRHRWLDVAMAPPMASDVLGLEAFTIADLVAELRWPEGCTVGFVESVGGPRSPLASDGDTVDLASVLRPDLVLLVADAGLGTINAVRLCAEVLGTPLVVALNRWDGTDDLHRRNREYLEADFDVVVDPQDFATRFTP